MSHPNDQDFLPSATSSSADVNAATVACQPPAVAATFSELPSGDTASSHRSFVGAGVDGEASASASRLPFLLAPVEPAAVEVGCGQAPEVNSNPLTGSQAAVTTSQPAPLAVVAAATFSKSTLNSETRVDDGHWPTTADPAVPAAVTISNPVQPQPVPPPAPALGGALVASLSSSVDPELEALVSACESGWTSANALRAAELDIPEFLKRGPDNVAPFAKNASTFADAASSRIHASSCASDISKSISEARA